MQGVWIQIYLDRKVLLVRHSCKDLLHKLKVLRKMHKTLAISSFYRVDDDEDRLLNQNYFI